MTRAAPQPGTLAQCRRSPGPGRSSSGREKGGRHEARIRGKARHYPTARVASRRRAGCGGQIRRVASGVQPCGCVATAWITWSYSKKTTKSGYSQRVIGGLPTAASFAAGAPHFDGDLVHRHASRRALRRGLLGLFQALDDERVRPGGTDRGQRSKQEDAGGLAHRDNLNGRSQVHYNIALKCKKTAWIVNGFTLSRAARALLGAGELRLRRPVAAYIGLRYLRAQRSNQFASFVTLASAIGVALGVAALIVVLSVMNGFENELRLRLTSITGHAWVAADDQGLADWQQIREDLEHFPGITGAVPVVELEAVLARGSELSAAIVTGTDPTLEPADSPLRAGMREGSLDDLKPGSRAIILGEALAARIGARVGEPVMVLVPTKNREHGLQSQLRQFMLRGIFELGVKDHDGTRALVSLEEAAAMGGFGSRVAGIRVTTADIFSAPQLIRAWAAGRKEHFQVRDWTQDHATYFRAVRIERTMMMVLLSLIVGVAAFNIVATLVMMVTDKRGSIAILRTFGFSRADIVGVFAVQGIAIGWLGVIVGVAAGTALAANVDVVAPWLERAFGFQFMPADVYYLTSLPSELHWSDTLGVGMAALVMTAVATIYPAMRAAAVAPAEVLRYE